VTNNHNKVKYAAVKNLNAIFFSISYNPRSKTGKLIGSNSSQEVFSRDLFGTSFNFLSEPSYFKIDLSLGSGSPVLFDIHFCILENGKSEPNPDEMPIILGSSGALIFIIIVVIIIVCCVLKRKKKTKPDANVVPNDVELFEIHKNPYYESSSTDTEQKVKGNRDSKLKAKSDQNVVLVAEHVFLQNKKEYFCTIVKLDSSGLLNTFAYTS
jgi:hypothetical protein